MEESNEVMKQNQQARTFTNLLEFKDPEGDPLPKDFLESSEDPAPFTWFNTFDEVVEEWRRNHSKDGQLTKVQVNFDNGEVSIFKKMNPTQVQQDSRGRQWQSKRFNLNRTGDARRAVFFAMR